MSGFYINYANFKQSKSGGQIVTLLTFFIVLALLLYMITLNIGQLLIKKTRATQASEAAALSTASILGSYCRMISYTYFGGSDYTSSMQSWWEVIKMVIVVAAIAYFTAGAGLKAAAAWAAAKWAGGGGLVDMWLDLKQIKAEYKAVMRQVSELDFEQQLYENAIYTALGRTVDDIAPLLDYSDLDEDGLTGTASPPDQIRRFTAHYIERTKSLLAETSESSAADYIDALKIAIKDNTDFDDPTIFKDFFELDCYPVVTGIFNNPYAVTTSPTLTDMITTQWFPGENFSAVIQDQEINFDPPYSDTQKNDTTDLVRWILIYRGEDGAANYMNGKNSFLYWINNNLLATSTADLAKNYDSWKSFLYPFPRQKPDGTVYTPYSFYAFLGDWKGYINNIWIPGLDDIKIKLLLATPATPEQSAWITAKIGEVTNMVNRLSDQSQQLDACRAIIGNFIGKMNSIGPASSFMSKDESIYMWHDTRGWHIIKVKVDPVSIPYVTYDTDFVVFKGIRQEMFLNNSTGYVRVYVWQYDEPLTTPLATGRSLWDFRLGRGSVAGAAGGSDKRMLNIIETMLPQIGIILRNMPDKKYIKLLDADDNGSIERKEWVLSDAILATIKKANLGLYSGLLGRINLLVGEKRDDGTVIRGRGVMSQSRASYSYAIGAPARLVNPY